MAWNGDAAKKRLVAWATEGDRVNKKKLMKFFGYIDGNGQKLEDYSFPLGDIIDGEPKYNEEGLDFAFGAASGAHTGIVHRGLQKRIINIKKRERISLTETQQAFMKRHMAAASTCNKVIREDESTIEVPVVLMKEGVYAGTDGIPRRKIFEQFAPSARWLNGIPITRGHLPDDVFPDSPRIGQVYDPVPRPETRDVAGRALFFKNKLTFEELTNLQSGVPMDGSIAYRCNILQEDGIFENQAYSQKEFGDYVFYHYAVVSRGACSASDGCGVNMNEKGEEMTKEEKIEAPTQEVKENAATESAPTVTPAVTESAPVQTAPDYDAIIQSKLDSAFKPLLESITSLTEKLSAFDKSMNQAQADIKKLNEAEENRKKADASAKIDAEKKGFEKLLNAKSRENVDTLFTEFKTVGAAWFNDNQDKLMNAVPPGDIKGDGHIASDVNTSFDEMQKALYNVGRK